MKTFHNILGRIGQFAIIDILGTIVGLEIILFLLKKTMKFRIILYIWAFLLGILVHNILGIETPLNKLIFG